MKGATEKLALRLEKSVEESKKTLGALRFAIRAAGPSSEMER
jgi:hypothetical protein